MSTNLSRTKFCKTLTCLVTQLSSGAPTMHLLQNDFSLAPTFARISQGKYSITLTGAFIENKTALFITNTNWTESFGTARVFGLERIDNNTIHFTTGLINANDGDSNKTDGLANDTTIEIKVYNTIINEES